MNLLNVEHCNAYSHPSLCPFSVGSKTCKQQSNRDHMLWYNHHLRGTHDARSRWDDDRTSSQAEVDKKYQQLNSLASNRERFHSLDRFGSTNFPPSSRIYSALLRHEDRYRIRTEPESSIDIGVTIMNHAHGYNRNQFLN